MTDPACYLYAVTRAPFGDLPRGLTGVNEAPVRLVGAGAFVALVSSVDGVEFGEDGLRRNLENLEWLGRTARGHNRVVRAAFALGPVVPLGLATVYHDDERLLDALTERGAVFAKALDEIAGHTEWGIKGYAEPEPAAEGDRRDRVTSGAGYLQQLRERRQRHGRARQESFERAEEVHRHLAGIADAHRLHPPQNRELAGYQGLMVLNAAYLVDDARTEEFAAAFRDIARDRPDLRLEMTGPWAAYSFADIRGEEDR